jgi:hypothetical protein
MPWSFKIALIVLRAISWPSLFSPPLMRVYPPGRVFVRHPDDERGDVGLGTRPTGASLVRPIVFCGDELPVPPQDGVGCDDAGDVREPAPAERLAFHGEAASLVVGET